MNRAESTVHVADFADKLLHLVASAEGVRVYAETTSNPRLVLQAIKTQTDTLSVLLHRLGIDSEETVELHRDAKALTSALAAVIRGGQHPTLPADLADRIEERGQDALAATVRRLAIPQLSQFADQPKETDQ